MGRMAEINRRCGELHHDRVFGKLCRYLREPGVAPTCATGMAVRLHETAAYLRKVLRAHPEAFQVRHDGCPVTWELTQKQKLKEA